MLLTTAAQTDIGLVRRENEDRLLCSEELRLFAVADGIGGLPHGAEAAEMAVITILREAQADADKGRGPDLVRGVLSANSAVLALANQLAPRVGIGTTLCVASITGGRLHLANVGDSRCYLFREGKTRLLTYDDTMENEVLERRRHGEQVVMEDHYHNAITRCIGQPMPLDVKVAEHALQTGDLILVCSDGISRLLHDSEIGKHLSVQKSPALILSALIAEALACGGTDNATGVIVRVDSLGHHAHGSH